VCKKVFVAATGKNCGKTTTCLALLHLARRKYSRVGFIKPIGPKPISLNGLTVDKDAALMAEIYSLKSQLKYMSPAIIYPDTTQKVLSGELSANVFSTAIAKACAELERQCDFLIIEGSGHSGVGSVVGLDNARVAKMLNAPVLIVAEGGIGNTIDTVHMNLALFHQQEAEVRMVLANKIIPQKREKILHFLKQGFAPSGVAVQGGFNFSPMLANPTLIGISRLLNQPLQGDQQETGSIIQHVQLCAASVQRVIDRLKDSSLLVVTSTRDELLVTLASLYNIHKYRQKIAGLVIPGLTPVAKIAQQILDRSGIPYLRTTEGTSADVYSTIKNHVSKITAGDLEKIAFIQHLAEKELDFEALDTMLESPTAVPAELELLTAAS